MEGCLPLFPAIDWLSLFRMAAARLFAPKEDAKPVETVSISQQAEQILDTYVDTILRYAYSYLHNRSDTEEVLQDTAKQQIGEVEAVTKFCTDCYDLLYAQATAMSLEAEKPEQLRRRLAASISMAETVQPVLELAARCARQTQPARVSSKAVRLAMRRIQSDYAQPLSLEQVAAEVHLTPEYFSRIFKEEVGVTFVNYLTDVRLRHSVQMLESTAKRVQDVAQAVGYPNVSYFSTIFKKKYGMSPYEYRHRSE